VKGDCCHSLFECLREAGKGKHPEQPFSALSHERSSVFPLNKCVLRERERESVCVYVCVCAFQKEGIEEKKNKKELPLNAQMYL